MDKFATRSALVVLWGALGSIGVIALIIGSLKTLGTFKLKSLASTSSEVQDSFPFLAMSITGLCLGLFGGFIIYFCCRRIYTTITQPMESGKNARAATPTSRALALMIFSAGTIVGAYQISQRIIPIKNLVTNYTMVETTTAKVLSFDDDRATGEPRSGRFIFYTSGQQPKRIEGTFEEKFKKIAVKPGFIFPITYSKNKPQNYYFKKPKGIISLLPLIMESLLFFWILAAGLAGIKSNLNNDDEDDISSDDCTLSTQFGGIDPSCRKIF